MAKWWSWDLRGSNDDGKREVALQDRDTGLGS